MTKVIQIKPAVLHAPAVLIKANQGWEECNSCEHADSELCDACDEADQYEPMDEASTEQKELLAA